MPVIAVTGYLGADNTTLLNHLLRRPGARLGVVVNDFGELNVDAALVAGQVDEAASISGGCLCCLPESRGLDDALERLTRPGLRFDAIVVEASGAADPLALARIIRYRGAENMRPGGVVEVVDAVEYFRTVDVWPEPPARYAAASLVVIGKTDLLPEDEREARIERIVARVRERNPGIQFVIADRGRIDPALVFDTAAAEDPPDQLPIARLIREASAPHGAGSERGSGPGRGSEHERGSRHGYPEGEGHSHAGAASIPLTDPVSPSSLIDLLEEPPAHAYRIKGRVRIRGPRREGASRRSPPRPDAAGLKRLHRYRRLSE